MVHEHPVAHTQHGSSHRGHPMSKLNLHCSWSLMGKDACGEPCGQTDFTKRPTSPALSPWGCTKGESLVGCGLPTLKPALCFPAEGGTGSQGFTSLQGQLFAQLQGVPFNCVTCHWHPLEPNSQAEALVCFGNRGVCLGKGPQAISLGAGRERTFTGFLPSRGPQTSDWMSRTDLPFPSSWRSPARGEMGTASTGPCPRKPACTDSWGLRAGRRRGSSETWGTCQCCLTCPQIKSQQEPSQS